MLASKMKPTVIFVLGGPGSGKGTQCAKIVEHFGYKHISAGDCLREERARPDSEYGALIESYIKEGKIVPVEVTLALLKKKMQALGWQDSTFLLDGFPRSNDNLQGWEREMSKLVHEPKCLFFNCPEEVLEARLMKRGETSGRSDDNLESIKKRFQTYVNETLPVVETFASKGLLLAVNANRDKDSVWDDVRKVLYANMSNQSFAFAQPTTLSFDNLRKAKSAQMQTAAATLGLTKNVEKEDVTQRFVSTYKATFGVPAKQAKPTVVPKPIGGDAQTASGRTNAVYPNTIPYPVAAAINGLQDPHLVPKPFTGPLKVVLFGPPASGKGTAASFIAPRYNLYHLSTGDLLRAKVKSGGPDGQELAALMAAGKLVPDQKVIDLVKEEVGKPEVRQTGWLLDGFPRTASQAESLFLEGGAAGREAPDLVIILKCPFEALKQRVIYRRVDPETNEVYSVAPGRDHDIPPHVRPRLIQRADDTEEALLRRVKTFESSVHGMRQVLSRMPKTKVVEVSALDANQVRQAAAKALDEIVDSKTFHSSLLPPKGTAEHLRTASLRGLASSLIAAPGTAHQFSQLSPTGGYSEVNFATNAATLGFGGGPTAVPQRQPPGPKTTPPAFQKVNGDSMRLVSVPGSTMSPADALGSALVG